MSISLAPFVEMHNRLDEHSHIAETYLAQEKDGSLLAVAITGHSYPNWGGETLYHYDVERYDGRDAEIKTIGHMPLDRARWFAKMYVAVGGEWMTLHGAQA